LFIASYEHYNQFIYNTLRFVAKQSLDKSGALDLSAQAGDPAMV